MSSYTIPYSRAYVLIHSHTSVPCKPETANRNGSAATLYINVYMYRYLYMCLCLHIFIYTGVGGRSAAPCASCNRAWLQWTDSPLARTPSRAHETARARPAPSPSPPAASAARSPTHSTGSRARRRSHTCARRGPCSVPSLLEGRTGDGALRAGRAGPGRAEPGFAGPNSHSPRVVCCRSFSDNAIGGTVPASLSALTGLVGLCGPPPGSGDCADRVTRAFAV